MSLNMQDIEFLTSPEPSATLTDRDIDFFVNAPIHAGLSAPEEAPQQPRRLRKSSGTSSLTTLGLLATTISTSTHSPRKRAARLAAHLKARGTRSRACPERWQRRCAVTTRLAARISKWMRSRDRPTSSE